MPSISGDPVSPERQAQILSLVCAIASPVPGEVSGSMERTCMQFLLHSSYVYFICRTQLTYDLRKCHRVANLRLILHRNDDPGSVEKETRTRGSLILLEAKRLRGQTTVDCHTSVACEPRVRGIYSVQLYTNVQTE